MAALVGSLQRQWDRAAWQRGLRVERVGELPEREPRECLYEGEFNACLLMKCLPDTSVNARAKGSNASNA